MTINLALIIFFYFSAAGWGLVWLLFKCHENVAYQAVSHAALIISIVNVIIAVALFPTLYLQGQ